MPDSRDDHALLMALRRQGAGIRRVRFRENRTVLLSVSRDGATLNCHACFRDAPDRVVEAIATAVTARRGSEARRRALAAVRGWRGTREGLERARRRKPRRGRRANGRETAPLRALFHRLNAASFGGRLPEIPLRVSRRMTRSLGTVRYGGVDNGSARSVEEIAISADLLRTGNAALLEDTLLHEMAHAEAWLDHGHRGHGALWKAIARRVGCRPRAVNDVRVAGGRGRR